MAEIYINGEKIAETDVTKVDIINEELEKRERFKLGLEEALVKLEGTFEKPTFEVKVPKLKRKANETNEEYQKRLLENADIEDILKQLADNPIALAIMQNQLMKGFEKDTEKNLKKWVEDKKGE